jgi:hypothetical protein
MQAYGIDSAVSLELTINSDPGIEVTYRHSLAYLCKKEQEGIF